MVEDVTAVLTEIEHLVRDFSLLMVWQVEEHFDEVTMDEARQTLKVYLTFNMATTEKLLVTPGLTITITVTSD